MQKKAMMSKIKHGGFMVLFGIHTYIMFPFDLHPFNGILHFTKEKKWIAVGG